MNEETPEFLIADLVIIHKTRMIFELSQPVHLPSFYILNCNIYPN